MGCRSGLGPALARLHLRQRIGNIARSRALCEQCRFDRIFVYTGDLDFKVEPGVLQKLRSNGRTGREDDGDRHVENPVGKWFIGLERFVWFSG